MDMIMTRRQEHFTLATREALSTAQREAVRMNAVEVLPEHLFFGVLAQDGDGVMEAFSTLGLDRALLRTQLASLFPSHSVVGQGDAKDVPLSKEAYACIEWAIAFATSFRVSSVQLEHVLLGCVRHQRIQPLLALLLINAGSILPSSVAERSESAYTATMDQLITSRIRRRSIVHLNHDGSGRILSSFERPALTFVDIMGFEKVKRELREVINFLRNPHRVHQDLRSYLYGLLLVGPAGMSRTLIGQALAGEAVVPLLSLSISGLLEMGSTASGDQEGIFGNAQSSSAPGQAERETVGQQGCRIIHDFFEQGKRASPCILCLDELDAFAQQEMREVGEQWQRQLCSEIDGCNTRPAMAVMAAISRREQIDQLLVADCFDHTATLDETDIQPFEGRFSRCPACHQEVCEHWRYCGFCGGPIARGPDGAEGKGIIFCPECGNR